MNTPALAGRSHGWSSGAGYTAIATTALSALCLVLLHLMSPEFRSSERMVSEYALGAHPMLVTLVFAAWAVSSFVLLYALWPLSTTCLGRVGLVFLLLAAVGQTLGALFDITHRLHGPAAMLGIPSLCVAALLLRRAMSRRDDIAAPPAWSAHLLWISFFLTLIGVFSSRYGGWGNRLYFVAAYLWALLTSMAIITAPIKKAGDDLQGSPR